MKGTQVSYGISQRRACQVLRFSRSTCRYRSIADDRAALRIRLRDLAGVRVKYGYRRLHLLLQREGWEVNHILVYRLCTEECLGIRRRGPRRHRSRQTREKRPVAGSLSESWSMDFMADQLFSGRRFRLLTLVDNFSRESLAIEAGQRLTGDDVVRVSAVERRLCASSRHNPTPRHRRIFRVPDGKVCRLPRRGIRAGGSTAEW